MKIRYSDLSDNERWVPSFAFHALSVARKLTRPITWPHRADPRRQCGADIVAPEWSEHLAERRIRNVWFCDLCGYQFEDTVYLSGASLQPGK